MSYSLRVVVHGRPAMNVKRHWRVEARDRRKWREHVCAVIPRHLRPEEPLERARVHFDCWRAGNEPDRINLAHSCKPLLDALQPPRGKHVGCGVILDDKPAHCDDSYTWHRAKRGEDRVVITVEAM